MSSQRGPLSKYLRNEMNEIVSQAPSKRTRPSSPEKIRAALHHNFELSQVPQDVANDIIGTILIPGVKIRYLWLRSRSGK